MGPKDNKHTNTAVILHPLYMLTWIWLSRSICMVVMVCCGLRHVSSADQAIVGAAVWVIELIPAAEWLGLSGMRNLRVFVAAPPSPVLA